MLQCVKVCSIDDIVMIILN